MYSKKITFNLDIAVGVASRICGFHQQDTGSTPGMGNLKKNLN